MSSSSSAGVVPTLYEQVIASSKRRVKQEQEAESAPKQDEQKPSRHLGRRTTEEQADRAIESQFPHTSLYWRHNAKDSSGAKLREVVIQAKRDCRRSKGRLGPTFWSNVRKRFKPGDNEVKADVDQEAPCDRKLHKAFKQATSTNTAKRSKSLLMSWLRSCAAMSDRDLLALCRFITKLKLAANPQSVSVVMQVLKAIVRTNSMTTPAQQAIVRQAAHTFDHALVLSLGGWRRGTMSDDRWLNCWRACAAVVMDVEAAERVFAARGSWASVAHDVSRLCAQTHLGSHLFSWAKPHCVASRLREHAENLLKVLDGNEEVTAEKLAT